MKEIIIKIPKSFENYLDAAIVRATYLYPNLEITKSEKSDSLAIISENGNFDRHKFQKDFLNILYRERIYSDTLAIRKTIYGTS